MVSALAASQYEAAAAVVQSQVPSASTPYTPVAHDPSASDEEAGSGHSISSGKILASRRAPLRNQILSGY
jgi:hypothetical protein